ncbi:MAG: protein kinase [Rhodothermales bacterium]|nr:protein kinase [Rhodothermales bacterium]
MIGSSRLHYDIIEKLGEGGMGVVYKAHDTKLKRHVAIKFMPWRYATIPDVRTRFRIEAQAAATLNHPNIATIYAIEELTSPDGVDEIFFVMEYIDGMELKRRIQSSEIPLVETVDIALQIAEGLSVAHEHGITHRDIKPANIMLTPKGRIKLMDFGLAKIGPGIQLTQNNTTLGTLAYMSPEQARAESVDYRSDIWSFGVVLYEMLAGTLPFADYREHALIYAIIHHSHTPLTTQRPELPASLAALVERAMQKDPNDRFQGMDAMILELKRIRKELRFGAGGLDDGDTQLVQPTLPVAILPGPSPVVPEESIEIAPAAPEPVRPRRALQGLAIALIVLVVAVGSFYGLQSEPADEAASNAPGVMPSPGEATPDEPELREQASDEPSPDEQVSGGLTSSEPLTNASPDTHVDNPVPGESPATGGDTESLVAGADPATRPSTEPPSAPVQAPTPTDTPPAAEPNALLEAGKNQATAARAAMQRVLDTLPADETLLGSIDAYGSAREAQRLGETAFEQARYDVALAQFSQAETGYRTALTEALVTEEARVNETRRALAQLMARVTVTSPEPASYTKALAKEAEGNRAFQAGDYALANQLLLEGVELLQQLDAEHTREAEEKRHLETLIDEAKQHLTSAFLDENFSQFSSAVALSASEQRTWTSIFASFKNFQFTITRESLQNVDPDTYIYECGASFTYTNNKNEKKTTALSFQQTLTREATRWTSSKFSFPR